MKELFTIGEVAGLFKMNAKTLRYYDEIDLVKAEYKDPKTGYRYYSTRQFERLNTILYLRALDVPLERIRHFFCCKDTDTMLKLLRSQQEEIQNRMRTLRQIDQKISLRLSRLQDAFTEPTGCITDKYFKPRPVFFLRKEIPATDDLEYPIRELTRQGHFQSSVFLGKIGISISMQAVCALNFSVYAGIFILTEEEDDADNPQTFLPGGRYLTLRFTGTHTQAAPHYKKLLSYMEEARLSMAADPLEITLIDLGMTDDPEQFITELQVPVKSS